MKKFIISIVLLKITKVLEGNGEPQMSMQNEVNVISADTQLEAYQKCAELAKLKHPGHNIVIRVIVDMDQALEEEIN